MNAADQKTEIGTPPMNPTTQTTRSWLVCLLTCTAFALHAQESNAVETAAIEPDAPAVATTNIEETTGEAVAVLETAIEPTVEVQVALTEEEAEPVVKAVDAVSDSETGMPEVPSINVPTTDSEIEGMKITKSVDPVTDAELLSVNFENVPLDTVVRFISLNAEVSIIIPEGLDKEITATLYNQEWRPALETILDVEGFTLLETRGGIFTIKSGDDLASDPLVLDKLEFKFITVEDALPVVQGMLVSSNASVTALERANVIYISETALRIQEIKDMLQQVDLPRRQVFIGAKFVELNDTAIEDLGINWTVLQGYTVRASGLNAARIDTRTQSEQDAAGFVQYSENGSYNSRETETIDGLATTTATTGFGASDGIVNAASQGKNFTDLTVSEGKVTFDTEPIKSVQTIRSAVLSADDFALTLSALKQMDGVRIVSNPKLLVANGEEASIHVGTKEPNIRATLVETGNQASYVYGLDATTPFIETGVKVNVKPVINTERNISIAIKPELSRIVGQKTAGDANIDYPIVSTRTIETEFAVESGKTVAIGGLTAGKQQESVKKVPVLGDIPVLGKYLFTHTHTEDVQDEVIIFVTVEMGDVETLDATAGVPQEGRLIQAWLEQNSAESSDVEDKSIDEILDGIE